MGRGRHAVTGMAAGLTAGLTAWVAAPLVDMARRGTVDDRTRAAWRSAQAPTTPPADDPRVARARHRAAIVAAIPTPRAPLACEHVPVFVPAQADGATPVVVPAARRSPRRDAGAAD